MAGLKVKKLMFSMSSKSAAFFNTAVTLNTSECPRPGQGCAVDLPAGWEPLPMWCCLALCPVVISNTELSFEKGDDGACLQ